MITIQRTNISSGEVINHKLTLVDREAGGLEASKLTQKAGTTELRITVAADGVLRALRILTAKDIVTRVIATELKPAVLTTGDIAWDRLAAADAGDGAADRPRRSRDGQCEGLAVLDRNGRLVGTVRSDEFIRTLGVPRNLAF